LGTVVIAVQDAITIHIQGRLIAALIDLTITVVVLAVTDLSFSLAGQLADPIDTLLI